MANHWSSVSTIIIMAGQRILCLSTHLSILVDNSSIDPGTRFSSPSRRWRYWITVQVPAEARLFKIVGAPVMWINNELWSSAEGRRSRCHVDLFRCKLFISGTTVTLTSDRHRRLLIISKGGMMMFQSCGSSLFSTLTWHHVSYTCVASNLYYSWPAYTDQTDMCENCCDHCLTNLSRHIFIPDLICLDTNEVNSLFLDGSYCCKPGIDFDWLSIILDTKTPNPGDGRWHGRN
jgi:hypothetical protein